MRLIDADALIEKINQIKMRNSIDIDDFTCGKVSALNCAIDIIRDSQTIGGWINVNSRLPNNGQIVIASDGEHTWDVGMYKSFCGKPSEWNWKKNTLKTVLWWMPKDGALPEPPTCDKS